MKKIISVILCLCLLLSIFPVSLSAFAYDDDKDYFSETVYEVGEEGETGGEPVDEESEESVVIHPPIEEEDDLYGNFSFDLENSRQLQAEYVSDEIVIKFKEPWQVPGKEKQLQQEIDKVVKVGFVGGVNGYVVKVDDLSKNPNAILNRFKNNKYIESVEPNYILTAGYTPNDPSFKTYQTAYTAIGAQNGWAVTKGENSPIVAIVDSGVFGSHADLPRLLGGYSAVASLAYGNDALGHGTRIAGIIGMVGDNGIGSAGLNWNALILPVKVDDASKVMTVANVAKGIIWAADNGARVINLSLGLATDSVTLKNAIDYAYNKGCAIFAATGNDGKNTISYPARYSNVMAVGATGTGTSRASYSNYGSGMGVVALGSFYTTSSAGGYTTVSGTSFACPQVAALASMIWGLNPSLTNNQVYDLILQGASGNGKYLNDEMGYGCINVGKTLELVAATSKPVGKPQYPTPPVITLNSFAEMSLFVGDKYQEMGYTAVDCLGKNITSAVKVTGTVDTSKSGLYTLTYTVTDDGGNIAKVIRTINVVAKPANLPPPAAPKITIIGSNPIILHLTSGTPYKEQKAKAIDSDGKDISNLVQVIGQPNRNVAGNYTITYKVVSPTTGLEATTTREVRILAPNAERSARTPYGFSGQAKQGAKVTHTGIKADEFGWMELTIKSIDKNMTIIVELIDTVTKKAVLKDTFSAAGTKQYRINEGRYELAVTVDKASGNSKYEINLLMPEVLFVTFEEEEVPLAWLDLIVFPGDDEVPLTEFPVGNTITYVVVKGDSLSLIAKRTYGDINRWHEIYEMNKDVIGKNPNLIFPGQVLTIKAE